MGAIPSMFQMGLAYCCCNSAGSLCNTCLGSTSTGTTGRKRSVLLLSLSIGLALTFQYWLAPYLLSDSGWFHKMRLVPGLAKRVYNSFTSSCLDTYGDSDPKRFAQCVSNAAVYRPTSIATAFFLTSAAATAANPSLNRKVWPAKYGIYFLALLLTLVLPNAPLFTGFYTTLLRLCAATFVLVQQVILIDVAYNWNDAWMEKSSAADDVDWGSGVFWLRSIIAATAGLFVASITGIVLLYVHFTGCWENTAVITLTLMGIVAIVLVQFLVPNVEGGSLLTTAVISAYATYLAYSVVSKNPNGVCNPSLGDNDVGGIVVGLALTMISLAWTGWSWTAGDRLDAKSIDTPRALTPLNPERQNPATLNLDIPFLNPADQPTTGVALRTADDDISYDNDDDDLSYDDNSGGNSSGTLWKLNVVLALVSCWVAASLTEWGSIHNGVEGEEHTAANPQVGRVNMLMIALSQQLGLILYGWTLVAPYFFPDRDFS